MSEGRQVFLFLCHRPSRGMVREFRDIQRATEKLGESFLLCHVETEAPPVVLEGVDRYLFSRASLAELGYPVFRGSLHPGRAQLPLLQFFRDNPGFEYYWLIEYDVRFSGDWGTFFSAFTEFEHDFIACHLRRHEDESRWLWWELSHPEKSIARADRLRSFNPLFRISKQALGLLHRSLRDGWSGHYEVLMPTLIHLGGLQVMDFGGEGPFVPPGMENRFYTSRRGNLEGRFSGGTMRCRPPRLTVGWRRNRLYHPIKPLRVWWRETKRWYRKRASTFVGAR